METLIDDVEIFQKVSEYHLLCIGCTRLIHENPYRYSIQRYIEYNDRSVCNNSSRDRRFSLTYTVHFIVLYSFNITPIKTVE